MEWAATSLLCHEHGLGGVYIGRPLSVGDESAPLLILCEFDPRIYLRIKSVPALRPEGPISIRSDMLEVEALVAKLTCHQLCSQSDGRNVDPLAVSISCWCSQSLYREQVGTIRDAIPQLGVPFINSSGVTEQ